MESERNRKKIMKDSQVAQSKYEMTTVVKKKLFKKLYAGFVFFFLLGEEK